MTQIRLSKVFIAIMIAFCSVLCLVLGVVALKKGMTINVTIPINPQIRCELQMKAAGASSFTPIFSNVQGHEYLAPNMRLDKESNSIIMQTTVSGDISGNFELKVLNHTESMITLNTEGDGVSYSAVGVEAYDNSQANAPSGTMTISTMSGSFKLIFNEVYEVNATFDDVELDTTYDNTLIVANNGCYIPKGENLVAKFKDARGTNACPDVLSLTINSVNQLSAMLTNDWYNYSTQVLTLTSAQVASGVSLTSSIYWDGTYANEFASGDGTAVSPFKIATPKQLALLSGLINTTDGAIYGDNTYNVAFCRTANYQMVNNIYLNDEKFTPNETSGFVEVTDGTNTAYLGMGISTDFGANYYATMGSWYANNASLTAGSYLGTLYSWTAIGAATNMFGGVFDGNHKFISGLYRNSNDLYSTLFGKGTGMTLKNLTSKNGYLVGIGIASGFVNSCLEDSLIENCTNYNYVGVKTAVDLSAIALDTLNRAYLAGVIGYASFGTVRNCVNYGCIAKNNESVENQLTMGGVIAFNAGNNSYNCINYGNIISEFSGTCVGVYMGGVIGRTGGTADNIVRNVVNYGKVLSRTCTSNVSADLIAVGGTLGIVEICNVSYAYNLNKSDEGYDLEVYGNNNPYYLATITNTSIFNESNVLTTETYGTTDLARALNAWVVENQSGTTYKYWDYYKNKAFLVDLLPDWY